MTKSTGQISTRPDGDSSDSSSAGHPDGAWWLVVLIIISPLSVSDAIGQKLPLKMLSGTLVVQTRGEEASALERQDSQSNPDTVAEISGAEEAQALSKAVVKARDSEKVEATRSLSVEPLGKLLPDDRPSWLDDKPDLSSNKHSFVVASIPTSLKEEIDSNLSAPLVEGVASYVNELLADPRAFSLLEDRLTADFIRAQLVDDRHSYTAQITTSAGQMYHKWVKVEITDQQRQRLEVWYREKLQQQRLFPLALGSAGLLSLVGVARLFFNRRWNHLLRQEKLAGNQKLVDHSPTAKNRLFSKKGVGVAIAVTMAVAMVIWLH
jgi:hypothetical protein